MNWDEYFFSILQGQTMNWDEYFFSICDSVAQKSKDPSTKIGCVIVGNDNEVRSVGFNGFPRGVFDTPERYNDRETKLKLIEHAERNALYNAARCGISLGGTNLYVTELPVCPECAKGIIQCGITGVHMRILEKSKFERWKEAWEITRTMFDEAGVYWYNHGGICL